MVKKIKTIEESLREEIAEVRAELTFTTSLVVSLEEQVQMLKQIVDERFSIYNTKKVIKQEIPSTKHKEEFSRPVIFESKPKKVVNFTINT